MVGDARVQYGREARGDGTLECRADLCGSGDGFTVAAESTRDDCIVGALEVAAHLEARPTPSGANHAPGAIVVDEVDDVQFLPACGVQFLQRESE